MQGNCLLCEMISSEFVLSGPTLHRSFNKQPGTRQNASVIGVAGIRSKIECNTQCVHRSDVCMGFNFQRGPPVICEISRIPHDAPNSNMVVDSQWDHYAIVPWMKKTHFMIMPICSLERFDLNFRFSSWYFSDWFLRYILWKCPRVSFTGAYWW